MSYERIMNPTRGQIYTSIAAILGIVIGFVGIVHTNIEDHHNDEIASRSQLEIQNIETRLYSLSRDLARTMEHGNIHHSEPGPVGSCVCVKVISDKRPVFEICSAGPECDDKSVQACESRLQGFRCNAVNWTR